MITLTANITPAFLSAIPSNSVAELQDFLDGLHEMEAFFTEADLKQVILSFQNVIGDDGLIYDDISFRATARYHIAGDLWGQGDGFRINFTQYVRAFTEAFNL